jgi:hypothetical protein
MTPLTIRAHHLFCLSHANVEPRPHPTLLDVLERLKRDRTTSVRVVVGPDDICLPCPEWMSDHCRQKVGREERNQDKDRRYLERLGLEEGETLLADALYRRMRERVDTAFIREVCFSSSPDHTETCGQSLHVTLWDTP